MSQKSKCHRTKIIAAQTVLHTSRIIHKKFQLPILSGTVRASPLKFGFLGIFERLYAVLNNFYNLYLRYLKVVFLEAERNSHLFRHAKIENQLKTIDFRARIKNGRKLPLFQLHAKLHIYLNFYCVNKRGYFLDLRRNSNLFRHAKIKIRPIIVDFGIIFQF